MSQIDLMQECSQIRAERDAARKDAEQVRVQLLAANQRVESARLAMREIRRLTVCGKAVEIAQEWLG